MNPCPEPSLWNRLLEEELGDEAMAAAEDHLQECAQCREYLEHLTVQSLGALTPILATLRDGEGRLANPTPRALHLPGYEILRELAQGGMSVIYTARQKHPSRVVALKMVRQGRMAAAEERARFRAEIAAIARLRHPNIVQIYEVGQHDGHSYFTMELADGGSLAQFLAGVPQTPARAAELIETLAWAVQHAHEQRIVHRDLKPANVLLFRLPPGERTGCGTFEGLIPKITDFGLAKRIPGEDDGGVPTTTVYETQGGGVRGTPNYMAPEQARPGSEAIGPAADVHALGAILYEMLSGRPPFCGSDILETIEQVKHEEPAALRGLVPKLSVDLETICMKCLRKEPGRRYPSARALAEDLRRFLNGERILARPSGLWERGRRWVRRRPAVAVFLGAMLFALLGLAAAWFWYDRHMQETQAHARTGILLSADIAEVPRLLEELAPYRRWADPLLTRVAQDPRHDSRERLRAALALVDRDGGQVAFLAEYLLAARVDEIKPICDALADAGVGRTGWFWRVMEGEDATPEQRLRAACALAVLDPGSDRWQKVSTSVARQLVLEPPFLVQSWVEALAPVRDCLIPPLQQAFTEQAELPEGLIAAAVLAHYAADRPEMLVELVRTANPLQLPPLIDQLRQQGDSVVPMLERILDEATVPPSARLHQPWKTDPDFPAHRLARMHARAAVTLLGIGHPRRVWPLLRHSPQPEVRTCLLHQFFPAGIDPRLLIKELTRESSGVKEALLLALGEYPPDALNRGERDQLWGNLVTMYHSNPEPGVHSAIEWLARRWGESHRLGEPARELVSRGPIGNRRWYHTREGLRFAVVPGPVEVIVGSPPEEWNRVWDRERQWRKLIEHSYAVATTEVTTEQYHRFIQARQLAKVQQLAGATLMGSPLPGAVQGGLAGYSPQFLLLAVGSDFSRTNPFAFNQPYWFNPERDCPVIDVSWYDAARYCRWLSEQEGIPEDQMCYPPLWAIREGMELPANFLQRTGYRLPTEEEWEHACRAGTVTRHHYGSDVQMLPRYAHYSVYAENRSWPVGLLKPNPLGLFDVHGNVDEWCHNVFLPHLDERLDAAHPQEIVHLRVSEGHPRALRGGRFGGGTSHIDHRSAARRWFAPSTRWADIGFRVARTLPESGPPARGE